VSGARAFVTGTSSGLGLGLAEELLARGWQVFGCSRREGGPDGLRHRTIDLADHATIPGALNALLGDTGRLDLVVLNAGVLGRIRDMGQTSLEELQRTMDVNLWANKVVLDWLLAWPGTVAQVVLVSSGASVLGNRGWGGYALSKAALNMLARLYSHEFGATHVTALAPGIIDTAMMESLCVDGDETRYPALRRLRAARGTEAMPGPREAATRVLSVLPALRERPSGSFVDIREILDPDAYRQLFGRPSGEGR
jgi:NAD(P)-dependent dehydrogenase (short-subunit alcohol dehydrogenase family)